MNVYSSLTTEYEAKFAGVMGLHSPIWLYQDRKISSEAGVKATKDPYSNGAPGTIRTPNPLIRRLAGLQDFQSLEDRRLANSAG
jgi:hypothetical protein